MARRKESKAPSAPAVDRAAHGSSAFAHGSLLGDLSDFALDELKSGKRKTAQEAVRWAGLILCAREEKFNFRKVLRDVKRRMNDKDHATDGARDENQQTKSK